MMLISEEDDEDTGKLMRRNRSCEVDGGEEKPGAK